MSEHPMVRQVVTAFAHAKAAEYAQQYGEPQVRADGSIYRRIHVRCGDCGQRVVEVYSSRDEPFDLTCPDRGAPGFGPCGNDPLTAEHRDGPRYVEAVTGGRKQREQGYVLLATKDGGGPHPERGARAYELNWAIGLPLGWFFREVQA